MIEKKKSDKIDIVLLWVDGNDPKWLAEKQKYSDIASIDNQSNSINRFRDWDLLQFIFRSIEKNMPWIHRIHFVTWGHIPQWLNTNHPKLHIVKHEDFIPKEFLPTFNTNVIHYYLNQIAGLAEKFIVFDDDIYVLKPVKPTDFFVGNKIREEYSETVNYIPKRNDTFPHEMMNNLICINGHYNKREFYRKNLLKCLNPTLGLRNICSTILMQRWSFFGGFYNAHICQPYTKELFKKFLEYSNERIKQTSHNRVRSNEDYTIHLVRFIAFMEGLFVARNHKFGKRFELNEKNQDALRAIAKRKHSIICLNDSDENIPFEETKSELQKAFQSIFPRKSNYEK